MLATLTTKPIMATAIDSSKPILMGEKNLSTASFIMNMAAESSSEAIVKTIIELAKNLELDVVAEGIEHKDEACKLKNFGCQFGQGFYYGRPLDSEAATEFLKNQNQGS